MTENFTRFATVEADGIDIAAGRARLSFSSEMPAMRSPDKRCDRQYREVISHAPGDMNTAILNRAGVVLLDHNERNVIGGVVPGSVRIRSDRKAVAEIQIDPEWRSYLERIARGEAPNQVSVGYTRLSVLSQETGRDGVPTLRFSWQPYEISILTKDQTPADETVGFGRSQTFFMKRPSLDEILQLALSGSRRADDEQIRSTFSVADVIAGRKKATEIPWAALLPRDSQRRDMQATIFGQGGAFVQSDMHPAVEVLRNHMVCGALGAQVLPNLTGNFLAPKITSSVVPTSTSEIGGVNASDFDVDQAAKTPKRATAVIELSKQWAIQAEESEDISRAMLVDGLALDADRGALLGAGGQSEPTGIFNLVGVSSIVFGGSPTYPKVLGMAKALTDANADRGSMGFAVSGAVKNAWRQTSRISATNYPSFILEKGMVDEFPVKNTESLSGTNKVCFGNFSDLYILVWGNGIEITVDPVTLASKGKVRIIAHLFFDTWVRHAESFCISADSGCQ